MQKNGKVLAVIGVGLFLAFMIYSLMGVAQVSCEVCINFSGRTACSMARGANAEEAQHTATRVACASLASGMTDSIACGNTPPVRLMCK
jgi:hypothetical protein